jgi:hypothetical protein
MLPKLLLLMTAMLWGSYAPSLRLVFTSPGPPDPIVVMAIRGVLQAAVLVAASSLSGSQQSEAAPPQLPGGQQLEAAPPQASTARPEPGAAQEEGSSGSAGALLQQWLTLRSPPLWMAAVELGLWNYLATASQVQFCAVHPVL